MYSAKIGPGIQAYPRMFRKRPVNSKNQLMVIFLMTAKLYKHIPPLWWNIFNKTKVTTEINSLINIQLR